MLLKHLNNNHCLLFLETVNGNKSKTIKINTTQKNVSDINNKSKTQQFASTNENEKNDSTNAPTDSLKQNLIDTSRKSYFNLDFNKIN